MANIIFRPHMVTATGMDFPLARFTLEEGYNTGWKATVLVALSTPSDAIESIDVLATLSARGVSAGLAAKLYIKLVAPDDVDLDETVVRHWPCMIASIRPILGIEDQLVGEVVLADPVAYLAGREIWGAYRSCSLGEIVGGAISLAARAGGRPTLMVKAKHMPRIDVYTEYRDSLIKMDYAIAAGNTLASWLARVSGMLGLRLECGEMEEGDVFTLRLTDQAAKGRTMHMTIHEHGQTWENTEVATDGPMRITGRARFPWAKERALLLDDPTQGSPRPVVSPGPIGAVISTSSTDIDEATLRSLYDVRNQTCEELLLYGATRHSGVAPGTVINFDREMHRESAWQATVVKHVIKRGIYDNDVVLVRNKVPWHPPMPSPATPRLVTGVIDHDDEKILSEYVPRDRLGRIKVRFSFLPTPMGEELETLIGGDTNRDMKITREDFSEEQITDYTTNEEEWENKKTAYEAGDYADPYPTTPSSELDETELDEREAMATTRQEVLTYMAYKQNLWLKQEDADRDGVLSRRDALVSEEMKAALSDPELEKELAAAWVESQLSDTPSEDPLVQEYGQLFGNRSTLDEDDEDDQRMLAARSDAEARADPDRWPPRIPLPVVEPMAGAMHGFVGAHRQGDVCRVMVNDPFNAEIVGFQYRDNRRVNTDIADAMSAMVVEHDYVRAWSGIAFRRSEEMGETPQAEEDSNEGEEDSDESEEESNESEEESNESEEESMRAMEDSARASGSLELPAAAENNEDFNGQSSTPD